MKLTGITVLVCDDEMCGPLCDLVRSAGATCEAYPSFTEARERLNDDPEFFDVAIIDLNLLNGKGSDLIRELRLTHPGLPCILLSGATNQEVMREKLDCIFLAKPVEAKDLYGAIISAVESADTAPPRPW